jgi:hypothetical protein
MTTIGTSGMAKIAQYVTPSFTGILKIVRTYLTPSITGLSLGLTPV